MDVFLFTKNVNGLSDVAGVRAATRNGKESTSLRLAHLLSLG